uniref:tRNA (adenine(58)-N(1))-methyltransferase non-catalytic subunit TRM6 n=1 Tax=Ditylenchus dipsaci TaxID=166011 RepID=A0A915D4H7_9BILA
MIAHGKYVMIQKIGGDHIRVLRVNKHQKILIEKLNFHPAGAIGKPFGLFEVCSGKLAPLAVPVPEVPLADQNIEAEIAVVAPPATADNNNENAESAKDNIAIEELQSEEKELEEVDDDLFQSSIPKVLKQKLTHGEVRALKDSGLTTSQLVSKLVDGNISFNGRTAYSQQKYIQKKTKRHSDRVLILKPTIRLLIECYYRRAPERISNLRLDQLSLMLELAGIHVGCRVLIYEQVLGALTAAVMERIAGEGACVFLHRWDMPQSIPCVQAMEFSPKEMETFCPLRITSLLSGCVAETSSTSPTHQKDGEDDEGILETVETNSYQGALERKRIRLEREKMALKLMHKDTVGLEGCGTMDSIMLALRTVNAVDLLEKTYKSLRLSGTIVIYSAIQQELITAYDWLREQGAVNLQMSEQFYRAHQVLSGRTHPLMQQPVATGYILSGIKVKKP